MSNARNQKEYQSAEEDLEELDPEEIVALLESFELLEDVDPQLLEEG